MLHSGSEKNLLEIATEMGIERDRELLHLQNVGRGTEAGIDIENSGSGDMDVF